MSKVVVKTYSILDQIRFVTSGWNIFCSFVSEKELNKKVDGNAIFISILRYVGGEKEILLYVEESQQFWHKRIPYLDGRSYQETIEMAIEEAGFKLDDSYYREKVIIKASDVHRLLRPANIGLPALRWVNSQVYSCRFAISVDAPVNESGNWTIEWCCNRIAQPVIYMSKKDFLNSLDKTAYFRDLVIQRWELEAQERVYENVREIQTLIEKRSAK